MTTTTTYVYKTAQEQFNEALAGCSKNLDGVILDDISKEVVKYLWQYSELEKSDLISDAECDGDDSSECFTTVEYYEKDLEYLATIAVVKTDHWLRENFKTTEELKEFLDNQSSNTIRDYQAYYDLEALENSDDFTEALIELITESDYAYLIAHTMLGSGVGLWEYFSGKDFPCLNSIV